MTVVSLNAYSARPSGRAPSSCSGSVACLPARPTCRHFECGTNRRRQRRAGPVAVIAGELPAVDWSRRSLQQILFVDRSDTVRARFAVGMFERVAGAVGASRVLQAWPCGVQAEAASRISWSTQASLFSLADSWRLRPHLFTAARQRWEDDDIDRFELVVCLDGSITAEVLKDLSAARPAAPQSYVGRICCLSDFLMYCSDEALLQHGSGSLLDRQLRELVRLALPWLRPSAARVAAAAAATGGGGSATGSALEGDAAAATAVAAVPAYMLPTGIQRPALQGGGGLTASHDGEADDEDSVVVAGGGGGGSEQWEQAEAWERMALLTAVCCAGLVQYLLDCRPDDAAE